MSIAEVLGGDSVASEAYSLHLISREEWPTSPPCYRRIAASTSKLGLTASQIFELQSGTRIGRPLPTRPGQLPGGHEALSARPWTELLNDEQKAKLTGAKKQLQLAGDALRLGFIACPMCGGESLCQ